MAKAIAGRIVEEYAMLFLKDLYLLSAAFVSEGLKTL